MAGKFDPYHTWLGIPPEDQPVDFYRLLGVKQFEADANVIDNAADRQMAHLRRVRTGQHAQQAERLLNEVAKARGCLLDAGKKAAYDQQLHTRAAAESPVASIPAAPVAPAPQIVTSAAPASRAANSSSLPLWLLAAAGGVAVCVVGVVVVAAAIWFSASSGPSSTPNDQFAEVAVGPAADQAKREAAGNQNDLVPPSTDDAPLDETPDPPGLPSPVSADDAHVAETPTGQTPDTNEPPASLGDAALPDGNNRADVSSDGTADNAVPPVAESLPGIVACAVLETKRQPIGLASQAIAFSTPVGEGRSGSNGVLLASPAGWEQSGTSWTCAYQYSGTAQGIHFIHPIGQGHIVATVYRGLRLASPPAFYEARSHKLSFDEGAAFEAITSKEGLPPCRLESRLSADGAYSLWMDGELIATARLHDIQPLTFEEDFTGGEGFEHQLPPGMAGVLLAPMDGGKNRAENVRLAALSPTQLAEHVMQVAKNSPVLASNGDSPPAGPPDQVASVDSATKDAAPTTGGPSSGGSASGSPADGAAGNSAGGAAAASGASTPSSEPAGGAAEKAEPKSDWKPPTKNSKQVFRSFLGMYRNGMKKNQFYPVINLSVPNKDLWTQEIQNKLRGSIPFAEIGYIGMAKIVIPEDGVYVLDISNRGTKVSINGRDTGGSGEVRLPRGIHSVTLSVGTHGQPYLHSAAVSLKHKETGEEVPFVNSWQDILKFTSQRVAGVPVVEVSGWEPSEDKEVDVTPSRRR